MSRLLAGNRVQAKRFVFLRHLIRRLFRPRLHLTIVFAILCAVLVAEIVWLVPATILHRNERLEGLRREVQLMLRAAVDHTTFPTIDTEIEIGRRLMAMSPIRGGVIFNAVGTTIDGFGERPEARPDQINYSAGFVRMVDTDTMETVYLDQQTGLPHHILLKIDVSDVNQLVLTQIWRSAISMAAIIGFSLAVLLLIVHYLVLRPLATMRRSAIFALENPEFADEQMTHITRGDEIGDMAKALDQLLFGLSLTYREDFQVLESMIRSSAIAIVTYSKDGRLCSANDGALKLFGVRNLAELGLIDQDFLIFKSSSTPQSLLSTLEKGDYRGQCRIITKNGQRPILIAASSHRDDSNRVMRHSMFIVDISRYVEIIEEQSIQIDEFNSIKGGMRAQIAELKLAFESCMLNMEQSREPSRQDKGTVHPDRIVAGWLDTFTTGGEQSLFQESLPPVYGSSESVRNIFRQALTFVQLKSAHTRPNISIGARVEGPVAYFTISDDSGENQPTRKSSDPAHGAWPLALKAFHRAMTEEGVTTVKLNKGDTPYVTFSLPLDIDAFREQKAPERKKKA